jgi:alpha-tubulin suppressor-like RCC1 family protein
MRASVRSSFVLCVLFAVLAIAGAVAVLGAGAGAARAAAYGGISNPSFEAPPPGAGYVAEAWNLVSQATTGNAVRLTGDDGTTYPVFGTMGAVTPRLGTYMLRIGIPKGTDSHQAKGVTKVSQTFVSDGSDIGVAYRIFTWEHRDTDVLVIDVKKSNGQSVGRLADKEMQGITPTSVVTGAGTLPYTLDLNVEPRQAKYLATPWQDVRITDLAGTAGQTLTITYLLDTNTSAAHDSWVYLDLVDIVKPTVSISAPATGSVVTTRTPALSYSAVDDAFGCGIAAGSARVSIDGGAAMVPSATLPELSDGTHHITLTVKDQEGNTGSATSEFTVTTDSVAPTTSATPTGTLGDNDWYRGPVAVSLDAHDNPGGAGLATTFYRIGAGEPQVYGGVPFFIADDGVNEVAYWSVDLAGNDEAAQPLVVKIDDQDPLVTLTSRNDGDSRYNRPVFDFGASDACSQLTSSGLALRLSRYDPGTQAWTDPYTLEATSGEPLPERLDNGTYEFSVTALDKAGNVGTATHRFSVEAPPITVAAPSPWEGDIVGLYAGPAWIPDEGGTLGSLAWIVSNPAESEPITFEDPFGFVVLDTTTDYDIRLTVTDDVGDGATGAICEQNETLSSHPVAPRVHALDIEVLDGQPAELVGRFIDPGWAQTHQASWQIEGIGAVAAQVTEDNFPAMGSGYVYGMTRPLHLSDIPSDGTLDGALTVSDGTYGGSTTVPFSVTVRANTTAAHEDGGSNDEITASTPTIRSGGRVLQSYIQSADDVDIYLVTGPNGEALPCDTEVLVTLRDLPVDCDVAIIQDASQTTETVVGLEGTSFPNGDAWANAGKIWGGGGKTWGGGGKVWGGGGKIWGGGPVEQGLDALAPLKTWQGSPAAVGAYASWMDAGKVWGGGGKVWGGGGKIWGGGGKVWGGGGKIWGGGGKVWGGGESEPFRSPELSMLYSHLAPTDDPRKLMDGYSFYDLSFTGLDEDRASGADISFEELGFSNEQAENMSISGFSAMSGTEPEVVLAQVDLVDGRTFIAVKGANGASSADHPYSLQVETSEPLDVGKILNVEPEDPIIPRDEASTTVDPVVPAKDPEPKTLFVTQADRMTKIYGETAWSELEGKLYDISQREDVDGIVLSVPAVDYVGWDEQPWDTRLANDVTDKVRQAISDYIYGHVDDPNDPNDASSPPHLSIRYVVLVGSDQVIPQRRVIDQTLLCNEQSYARDAGLNVNSAVLASMNSKMILTDDFYVDAEPIPYNGRSLYIPDLAVARLVETPQEIVGTLQQFIYSEGTLAAGTSLVTGQEWMNDGAKRVNDILKVAGLAGPIDEPLLDTWTVQDVRERLLAGPAKRANINAHFTHYGGISAAGCVTYSAGQDWTTEFLTSTEIAEASGMLGKLVFSLGCHAGLNVPDDQAATNWDVDLKLDVPQAVAQQKGVLVASTGYGLGDLNGIAGTEALVGTFADQATTADGTSASSGSGQPIGLALAMAKRQYINSLTAVTPYDEKSSIQFTMYGMPQYRITCSPHPASTGVESAGVLDPARASIDGALPDTPLTLTMTDEDGTVATYDRDLIEASSKLTARYITASGDAEVIAARPIQPRVVINLGTVRPGEEAVSGAIVTDGEYFDVPGFDPAISHFVNEWETHIQEPQVCSDGWWPANPVTVSTIDTPEGLVQRLIVIPGQFMRTSADGERITGTERVWKSLDVKLFRKQVTDADTIAPTVRSVMLSNEGADWTALVDAADSSGIARIDVTQIGEETADFFTFPVSGPGPYPVTFPLPGVPGEEVSVMVTVHDGAGNITTSTAKGFLVTGPPVGTMSLNGGTGTSHNSLVDLDSSRVSNAREVRVSTDDGATWSEWRPFAPHYVIPLPGLGLPGERTVRAQYRNDQPGMLEVADAIELAPLPLDSSYYHTLALEGSGALWAWGGNPDGQLGDGTTQERHAPVHISNGWSVVSASDHHSLAIENGRLWAWGANSAGELGDGTTTPHASPARVGTDSDWATVSAGSYFSVGTKSDGTLWGWGTGGHNGDGTGVDRLTPVPIGGGSTGWRVVSARGTHAVALKADGSLWAWGSNLWGELGDGSTTARTSPVRIGTDGDWVAVATGSEHTVALKADGSLWSWGWNNAGQLGGGAPYNEERHQPARVGPDSDWVAIAAGYEHSLALKADGTLWAWGHNWAGQLGDGTATTARNVAVQIGGPDWATISAGGNTSTAIRTDGTLWSWGLNWNGQVGDGTTDEIRAPESIGLQLGPVYTVTASAGPGGAISPNGTVSVGNGDDQAFTIAPDAGYHIVDVLVDGVSQGAITSYSFTTVAEDHSITASFAADPVAPAVTGANGGESWVIGSAQEITWTPGSGGAVKIELSRDDGASWETLYTGASNDGSESWTVSGPATSQALARVSNDAGSDTSDVKFTIGLFAAKVDYATGTQPLSVAVGDFNGDGKQDLATANNNDDTLSVLLGDGSGGFAAKTDFTTGARPHSVAVGDFDGDGKRDLATANYIGNSVSILLGDGSGGFSGKTDYATGGTYPMCVVAGDLNGDGKQDLVTAKLGDDGVSVLLGDGSGGFAGKTDYATGAYPYLVAVGDFNGDGKHDLATANSNDNTVSVLLNRPGVLPGALQFAGPLNWATTSSNSHSTVVGDFDGDGRQDLATVDTGGSSVSVVLGSGTGAFAASVNYATGTTPYAVAIGDFNGDGNQDLVTANSNWSGVSVLLGNGSGAFGPKSDFSTGGGSTPFFVAVDDFDRDGNDDLAVAHGSPSSVSILLGDGSGGFAAAGRYNTGTNPHSVAVGDFNGDGKLDLATANNSSGGGVSVLTGNGDGTFGPTRVDYMTDVGPMSVVVGDFNRDGRQDLAAATWGGNSARILIGNGDGTFTTGSNVTTGVYAGSIAVADFSGDGKQDVAVVNVNDGNISILPGNGDGTFAAKADYTVSLSLSAVAVGDFNRDGRPDLATANLSSNVSVLLNTTPR